MYMYISSMWSAVEFLSINENHYANSVQYMYIYIYVTTVIARVHVHVLYIIHKMYTLMYVYHVHVGYCYFSNTLVNFLNFFFCIAWTDSLWYVQACGWIPQEFRWFIKFRGTVWLSDHIDRDYIMRVQYIVQLQ